MNMNVYKFVKNYVCPHCNNKPNIPKHEEHITASIKECPCHKTQILDYPRSEMLVVNLSKELQVQIAVDANESLFRLMDISDGKAFPLLDKYNEIPHFYDKSIPSAIIFLETLVTFQ